MYLGAERQADRGEGEEEVGAEGSLLSYLQKTISDGRTTQEAAAGSKVTHGSG